MRKREIKVGMQIAHNTTGRHLGEVMDVLGSVVKYKPLNRTDIPYGIAGFTEIEPYGEVSV